MRPVGPSSSMVPASPASAPAIRKLERPRVHSLAPWNRTMVGLRPARLASMPKGVRLTSTHMPSATAAAMPRMVGDMPWESLIR